MPAGVGKKILSVHVVVDVTSKDGLRKFAFGLDKSTGVTPVKVEAKPSSQPTPELKEAVRSSATAAQPKTEALNED